MTLAKTVERARKLVRVYEMHPEYALPFLCDRSLADCGRLVAFGEAHPWLVPYASGSTDARHAVLSTPDPDLAAARVMEMTGGCTSAAFMPVVRRLRNYGQPEMLVGDEIAQDVVEAMQVPDRFWPPSVAAPSTPLTDEAQVSMMSFIAAAPFLARIAHHAGRDVEGLMGRFVGWAPYLAKLVARAGHAGHHARETYSPACDAIEVFQSVSDMVSAFETEVVRPAIHRIDPTPAGPPAPRTFMIPRAGEGSTAYGMALRILLRDGTLPRLVETAREWHRRSPAIARACAACAGDRMRPGPALFDRIEMEDGTYLTCLNEPHDLIAEGLDGPDPDGRPGLSHCVGSYVERVSDGQAFVLGVRAPDPERGWRRVATVEVARLADGAPVPEVVQHRGHANVEVPRSQGAALARALPAVARAMRANQGDPVEGGRRFDWTPILAEDGAWERVRDEWSFAIERGRRKLGHEAFLDGTRTTPGGSHGL